MDKQFWTAHNRKVVLWVIAVLLLIITIVCLSTLRGPMYPTVEPPTITPSLIPTEKAFRPSPTPFVEVMSNTNIVEGDRFGEIETNYPIRMTVNSSDVVIVAIYVPPYLASAAPVIIERVDTPDEVSRKVGTTHTHRVMILLQETMRVELEAQQFKVAPGSPMTQTIAIDDPGTKTFWSWQITAPETPGQHTFTVRAYAARKPNAVWEGNFKVIVEDLAQLTASPPASPKPTEQATPTPAAISLWGQIAQQRVCVLIPIALVLLIAMLTGGYIYLRRRSSAQTVSAPEIHGISPPLYQRLEQTLLRCGPFDNEADLHTLFVDARIAPWRYALPTTTSPTARVRAMIDILYNQTTLTNQNALVVFIHVLQDHTHPESGCSADLKALVEALESEIHQVPSP